MCVCEGEGELFLLNLGTCGSRNLLRPSPSRILRWRLPRLLRMIAHQWQDVQSQPPSALPAWSREDFRVRLQASRVGKEVLSLPFSHEEVLPFTSPYLTEWELLGKRWRALPEAERLQYKIAKVASSELTSGPPTTAVSTTLSTSAEASVCLSCWIRVRSLCPLS